tara:strand:+ start:3550 stop:4749 length:1200 start_codon:yes stop_codon:yes gene_type:complete
MNKNLILYSKEQCEGCEIVKELFHKINIDHVIIKMKSFNEMYKVLENVDDDDELPTSFPVVVDDKTGFIGGFEQIMARYNEPLLDSNSNRHSMYPITYPDIYEMYKKARASYWQPEEISLKDDMADWENLNNDEKHFISHILAFFSASDGIVNENINVNFCSEIEIPEARAFYAFQEAMETIHSETYSILLDKFVTDPKEKSRLQKGVETIPAIKTKAEWCFKYMNQELSFPKRLVAFACVEGIYFSGSFCSIFWLKHRGLMPGFSFSNELISRDEGLHTEFAVLLYSYIVNKLSEEEIYEIIKSAVKNEQEFIIESIPCKLLGMNSEMMSRYIEFVADRLSQQLGYKKIYHSENPFDFMENISLEGKTNFFEKRVGEYAKSGVMAGSESQEFSLEEEF